MTYSIDQDTITGANGLAITPSSEGILEENKIEKLEMMVGYARAQVAK